MGFFGKTDYERQCEQFDRQHAEAARQQDITRGQQEEFQRQLVKQQQQAETADRLFELEHANALRTGALLDRCESLAERMDAFLSRFEKRNQAD